jgi:capsular exopolysaccharide synthesis family protein
MLDSSAEATGAAPAAGRPRTSANREGLTADAMAGARAFWQALRRRRWVLLTWLLVVPVLSWVALGRMTPRYTAVGALIYQPSEYRVKEMQSALRTDPVTEAVMASQSEILQSLFIVQRVADRGNLFNNPEFNPALRTPGPLTHIGTFLGMSSPIRAPDLGSGPAIDAARNATLVNVQAALQARPLRFSHVLEVRFTATDPVVAAAAVNNAMDAYVKDQFARKFRAVRRMGEHLDKRATELRAEVARLEDRIATYRARQNMAQGMHAGMDAEQLSRLAEDLVRARGDLAVAEGRLDAARGKAGAAAQAAIAPSVVQLRVRQDQLATQAQAQQTRLGAGHPESEAARRQLIESERSIAAEIARVVAAIESERRTATERVAVLERNLTEAQREAQRTAQAQVPLNAMLRDVEVARGQLRSILESQQQATQAAAVETSEAHEISQALPPERPSWPAPLPWMAASAALALFLGLAHAYLLHLADTTIQSGEDLRRFSSLPNFAMLPEVKRRALGHLSLEDYVARRPLTAFAEQVRALRAGLWFGADRPRVIAITAARPAEGKTVLTVALARSATLGGERVLAIECDMRQPRFARRLHAQNRAGLAELLRGEAALADVVETDPVTGLAFIHAGNPKGDVLGLFMSEAMARLLATVRTQYELVLLDAPPVQAMTEARVIAAIADATVLCVRWRSTPRAVLRLALDLLEDANANVAGTVLTRIDPRAHVRSGFADAEVYHRRYRQYYQG